MSASYMKDATLLAHKRQTCWKPWWTIVRSCSLWQVERKNCLTISLMSSLLWQSKLFPIDLPQVSSFYLLYLLHVNLLMNIAEILLNWRLTTIWLKHCWLLYLTKNNQLYVFNFAVFERPLKFTKIWN
jgi:hypothetical protein